MRENFDFVYRESLYYLNAKKRIVEKHFCRDVRYGKNIIVSGRRSFQTCTKEKAR